MIRMAGSGGSQTVFLYEYATGGGLAGNALPASWAAEGHAMRRALADDFAAVPGVRLVQTIDSRFAAEGGAGTVVAVNESTEEETFYRLAAEADATLVVAPESDLVLFDRTQALERVGVRLLGSSSEAVRLAGNKYELGRHLEQHGIPTPPTRWRGLEDRLVDDLRLHFHDAAETPPPSGKMALPAVLKSNHGAGSIRTFLLDSFEGIGPEVDGDIMQPFLDGPPMSASFLVDGSGRAFLVGVGLQKMIVRDGQFEYLGGTVPCDLERADAGVRGAIAAVPGLRGWVGVEFLWDDRTNQAMILEINPRVTTSYVGLRRLLPRGELARIWLGLLGVGTGFEAEAAGLAERVHANGPVNFRADGQVGEEWS
jgi:predicted ATP-grasp superfamily ATP-dependent carboligase